VLFHICTLVWQQRILAIEHHFFSDAALQEMFGGFGSKKASESVPPQQKIRWSMHDDQ
jgi:hypothetical protein